MKRRAFVLLLSLVLLLGLAAIPAEAAAGRMNAQTIVGTTWYGEFNSYYRNSTKPYRNATTLVFDSCDESGNFTATTYSVNVSNKSQWCRCHKKGTIDFITGEMHLVFVDFIENVGNWSRDVEMVCTINDDGITGSYLHDNGREITFYWARTSEWALTEITEANVAGLIPETMRGLDMTQRISRAEFAAVAVTVYEALTGQAIEPYTGEYFTDISGNRNETNIRKAYAVNIAVGVGEGRFEPDRDVTREELATMLTRVVKKYVYPEWTLATDGDYALSFENVQPYADDADISDWARPSVYYLTAMGIVNGMGNNRFAPRATTDRQRAEGYATATREQAVVMGLRIYKFLNK